MEIPTVKQKRVRKSNKEYLEIFFNKHPELKTEKITCTDCGQSYLYTCKYHHMLSKRHILLKEMKEKMINQV